ncbi:MAG: TonB-dependent siderophore receptor [Acinetobacter sp.]|nr:TonB-dependent siderophore receptor [Acinetobacter sp.]
MPYSPPQLRFSLSPLSLAVFCSLIPAMSYANDNENTPTVKELDTIVVQAQGNWLQHANAEKVFQHAGARTIIGRERLDETASISIKDALKQIPGVQVQENNGTGGSDLSLNIGVRGLPARLSYRSTVLLDGVPLSFAPYGQPQLSLAPLSLGNIESIDIVRGAGSVRFGPQNVGGIINFTTRSIPDEFKGNVSLTSEFANDHIKYTPNLFVGGTLNNGLGLALLYSGTKGDGYREQRNKTDIDDVLLKTSYRFSDSDQIYFNAHHYNAYGEMPNGLTTAQYQQNPLQVTHFRDYFNGRRSDFSFRYQHKDDVNDAEILTYYIDTHRNSLIEATGTGNNAGKLQARIAPRDYKVFAIEPRFSRSYTLGRLNNEVTVGYRYLTEQNSELDGRSAWYAQGSSYTINPYSTSEGNVTAHAFYIDNRFYWGKWSITPGVRFESVNSRNTMTAYRNGAVANQISPQIKSNEWLPNLAILFRATDKWNIFANAGVSFGPQQNSQLARISSNLAESTTNNLHPEKSKNYEIGTKYKGDSLAAELTAFYLDFDEELSLQRQGGSDNAAIWTNLGATSHQGLEAGIHYDFTGWSEHLAGWSAYANYSYTKALHEAGDFKGKDLPLYSRHVTNVSLRYALDNWTINADVHARSKQYAPGAVGTLYRTEESVNGQTGNIPGYTTFATRVAYDFNDQIKGLKVAGGIKNMFDKQYFTRSTDNNGGKFVGQPRTFYIQASYDF